MGASERIDQISTDDWCIFAKATGCAPGFVLKRVAAIAEAVVTHADEVAKALVEQGADRAYQAGGGRGANQRPPHAASCVSHPFTLVCYCPH